MKSPTVANLDEDIRIVLIGDGEVGKDYAMISYCANIFPEESYVSHACEAYQHQYTLSRANSSPLSFNISFCTTPGLEDYDRHRPYYYPNTDIFLVCFSIAWPLSFANIGEKVLDYKCYS